MNLERIASCIEACNECAESCEYCADACLDDLGPQGTVEGRVDCVRLDRDCADLCRLVAAFLARGSSFAPLVAMACERACDACAAACERQPLEHCRACADACRACAEECRRMLETEAPAYAEH